MHALFLTLHVTGAAIVVGVLFLQSLAVAMALRLKANEQREGVAILQRRIHGYVYYPILAVVVLTGFWNALARELFSRGRWLHWKLVFVVMLVGLGLLIGQSIRARRVVKPVAMLVQIMVFLVSAIIVYLAVLRPF